VGSYLNIIPVEIKQNSRLWEKFCILKILKGHHRMSCHRIRSSKVKCIVEMAKNNKANGHFFLELNLAIICILELDTLEISTALKRSRCNFSIK